MYPTCLSSRLKLLSSELHASASVDACVGEQIEQELRYRTCVNCPDWHPRAG